VSVNQRAPVAPGVHNARVVLACRDQDEFRRGFLPRYRKDGIYVATRYAPRVGERIRIKVELLDNSIGYAGEAVVIALEQEGSCPGFRVLLGSAAEVGQSADVWSRAEALADDLFADMGQSAGLDEEARAGEPAPRTRACAEAEAIQVSIDELEIEPLAPGPPLPRVSRTGAEPPGMSQHQIAERLEVLAASALRVGDLEAAETNCQLAMRADPRRASLRILLRGIEARRRSGAHSELAQQ
jgi:hypothetical protein